MVMKIPKERVLEMLCSRMVVCGSSGNPEGARGAATEDS